MRTEDRWTDDDRDEQAYERDSGLIVRVCRALSGSIAAGLVVLAIVVAVASYVGADRGFPGPGRESLVVHIVAAVLAIVAQRLSDRSRGALAILGSVSVLLIALLLLWTQWWGQGLSG